MTSYLNTESVGLEGIVMDGVTVEEVEGQNIIVVEDLIDTGHSMKKIIDSISICKPKSLKCAILLYKKNPEN